MTNEITFNENLKFKMSLFGLFINKGIGLFIEKGIVERLFKKII